MAAVIFATSCLKEVGGDDPQQPQEAAREVTLNALALKTAIGDNTDLGKLPIVWEGGDMIAMAFEHSTNGNRAVAELISDIEEGCTEKSSKFKGQIDDEVFRGDYNEVGFAVYPSTAVSEAGEIDFTLPPVQTAREDGSFGKGINLLSTAVNLSQLGTPDYGVTFHNALSFLRFKFTSDVKSVTFEGTSPFTGKAPLKFDMSETGDGRLLIDTDAEWKDEDKNNTFTLKPADGKETFDKGVIYNVLVWPGDHTQLTMTLDVEGYKECVKVSSPTKPIKLEASKFYTITLNDEKLIVTELNNDLDDVIGTLGDINGELDEIEKLLSQIQSVSLVSEFVEDAAYARYSLFGSSKMKHDIELNYMVRPASVAEQLAESYSEYMSALLSRRDAEGNLSFATLGVSGVELHGDIMTVKIDADGINGDVYDGTAQGQVALQIAAGGTDILSDFAKLYPIRGAGLDFTRTKDIPVLKGASVSIPFEYAPNGDAYEISISGNPNATFRDNVGFYNGYVNVDIKEGDLVSQSVTVTLTSGGEVVEEILTFADAGKFDISYLATVDYVGGEVNVSVDKSESYGTFTMTLSNTSVNTDYKSKNGTTATYYNTWIREKSAGVQGTYVIDENAPTKANVTGEDGNNMVLEVNYEGKNERTANLNFEINNAKPAENGQLTYRCSVSITQKAYNTGFDETLYYTSGETLQLKEATSNTRWHLNLVILGDGFTKADLLKTGVFEDRAGYVADVFLNAIESDFRDRFNVYALVRQSSNSGIAENETSVCTYYETYKVGTSVNITSSGKERVKADVEMICSKESYDYYRTVAIVLLNSDHDGAASDYEFGTTNTSYVGDGYASFGYTMVPVNAMRTGGFVRHESVGHCLGRLADEYYVNWYNVALVNERHGYGFYRNVATDKSYWSAFKTAGYTDGEVDYISYTSEGVVVNNGLYRSVNDNGIMFNNNGTFNAVSRWAIYDRIRKQTEGYGNYWNDFLEWDTKNR